MASRVHISVNGAVQGVGFRPFVYGLAARLNLAGFVLNKPEGVEIELEGSQDDIDMFLAQLQASPPPLARVEHVRTRRIEPLGETSFVIRESVNHGERTVLIAPDLATCPDCLRELYDPQDRRFRYPFINCTNCGPRYTIIRDMPYDRANTTMNAFDMCGECRAEYSDPSNRRFHAEPTCCPVCGPKVWIADRAGIEIECADPIAEAIGRIAAGQVVAVKGLGGFHLACDAANAQAVRELRRRKNRDLKPFAVMARDLAVARRICLLDGDTDPRVDMLTSPERPILLLEKRTCHGLAEEVAPKSASFGVMLPYTPLHSLLMEGQCDTLVMTSGNISDEPIAHANDDALARLASLADCYLLHDRGIHIRTDDSVARAISGAPRFLRRSRGYAPFPVRLAHDTTGAEILAVGPELNNTVCLTRGNHAFLSHHIGDLHNLPAYESFRQAIDHLQDILEVHPRAIAADLHPDYLSTRHARECGLPLIEVQHHHAHIASVLAETGRTDQVIGVSFDGMGWGTDGTPWGGEFMVCDLTEFQRVGRLMPVAQPGGDAAARNPERMAYAYLRAAYGDDADARAGELLPSLSAADRRLLARLIARRMNCPMTSSAGRLFDAASALLGICLCNTFHAQAPMELEARAAEARDEYGHYEASIDQDEAGLLSIDGADIIARMVEDFGTGTDASACAARFHNSVAHAVLDMCVRIRENSRLTTVALSGGVFANLFLVERLVALLDDRGFEVLLNATVPMGDGGVSLGQAAVAAARLGGDLGRMPCV